jgi:hypothetical protein
MENTKKETIYKFFEKYGIDFIEDGSKEKILKQLLLANDEELYNILKPITPEWKERVEDLGYFRIFTDYRTRRKVEETNHKEISFMDSIETQKIPTYREVEYRNKELNRS